jgi:gluconate 2-dehydrogenase gamma chain
MVLGYTISAPVLAGVLNGCKASPELTFNPVFLTQDQAKLVSEVAEIIIPKTDTPGAKDVGVPGFVDLMLKECFKPEDQENFITGLKAFDDGAKTAFGDLFLDLDAQQQADYVKQVHDEAVTAAKVPENREKPRAFILTVKELTLVGFFTSEPGATQVLQYDAVPGAYKGCVPLAEVGKAWAT